MPLGEIYVKLSVTFADDPKVRALSRYGADAGLARDLYVQMVLHCKRLLTDGFVPAEQVGLLVYPLDPEHGNQLAKQLASVGLIQEVSNLLSKTEAKDKQGSETGWQVCAYVKRNGTKEDVERLSKVRAEAGRTGGAKSRKRPAQRTSKDTGNQPGKQLANQNGKQNPSNAVSVSVRTNVLPEDRDLIQTPAVSAGKPADDKQVAKPLTITQRSKRLTDAYAEAEPMCKWTAVNGVVLSAIKSDHFADDEIRAALLRLAAEGRSVTVDSLRTELRGFPARPQSAARPSTTDQRVAAAQALKAQFAMEDRP
jgi:hypothetical protein